MGDLNQTNFWDLTFSDLDTKDSESIEEVDFDNLFWDEAPDDVIPEEAIPEEAIPEEVIPEEAIPEEVIPEEVIPEEVVPETKLEPEVITEPETKVEDTNLDQIIDDLSLDLDETKEIISKVENTEVRDELMKQNAETQLKLDELNIKYDTLLSKFGETSTALETQNLDGLWNKNTIQQIQNSPEIQRFIALNKNLELWSELAKTQMEDFLKEELINYWYNIDELATNKIKNDKKWLAAQNNQWVDLWTPSELWTWEDNDLFSADVFNTKL